MTQKPEEVVPDMDEETEEEIEDVEVEPKKPTEDPTHGDTEKTE